ncbi:homeobox protein MIXL1-like [Prionailurus bengalensis]|uniref:homeobox protein MIXL1-like n=1 Tax=Prionailurus bengalensis TaxID=37029 RepID=UPI001CAA06FF|nr:homeobox protein MIXL1-like [Prionailurus bengalensis]
MQAADQRAGCKSQAPLRVRLGLRQGPGLRLGRPPLEAPGVGEGVPHRAVGTSWGRDGGPGPPSARTLPRPRKKRTVYLKEQLQELEKHFWANRYPSYRERVALAAGLNLDEHQVQVWFKNRRAKHSRLPKGRGTPGVRSPAPHGPSRMHPAAEPGTCSRDPAWWAPERGSQESVPAPAWPQNSFGADFVPDPLLAPNSTAVFSPQDPLEGPSGPVMSGYQEEEGPAEDDSELMTLLNL